LKFLSLELYSTEIPSDWLSILIKLLISEIALKMQLLRRKKDLKMELLLLRV